MGSITRSQIDEGRSPVTKEAGGSEEGHRWAARWLRKLREGKAAPMSKPNSVKWGVVAGSPRSQELMLLEETLRIRLRNAEAAIAKAEQSIPGLEGDVVRLTKQVMSAGGAAQGKVLDEKNAELVATRGRIVAFRAEHAQIQAEIQALIPNEKQTQERSARQQEFAELADERLKCDRQIDELIEGLRRLVKERGELSLRLRTSAGSFDLSVNNEALDIPRLEKICEMLPESISKESQRWYENFFGNSKSLRPYVVCAESLILHETFSDPGVYHFGETVRLTDEGAKELLRTDRRDPKSNFPFVCLPPTVMTPEDFQAMVEEGNRISAPSSTMLIIVTQRRQETARQQWLAETASPSAPIPGAFSRQ